MKLHLNEKICEIARWMVDLVQDRFRLLPFVLGCQPSAIANTVLSHGFSQNFCNFCPFVSPIKYVL
jgi:hypothetical protein